MADTLRIGPREANDEKTRVPNGESTEDGRLPPGVIDKSGRPASYRLQMFTPPEVEGRRLWGTFGANGEEHTTGPSEAPTRRVRYVRSMRRPMLAIATGAIAALVFLLGIFVYSRRAHAPASSEEPVPVVMPSSRESAVVTASPRQSAPEVSSTVVSRPPAPEPTSETPAVKPVRPPQTAGRATASPPAPPPDAGPPATATQPAPSGMMIPDPPY